MIELFAREREAFRKKPFPLAILEIIALNETLILLVQRTQGDVVRAANGSQSIHHD